MTSSLRCWYIIQYINWKHVKVTGKKTRLYLSMSEAVMPNILFRSFMSQSGLGGGGSAGPVPGALLAGAPGLGPGGGPGTGGPPPPLGGAPMGSGGGGPIGGGPNGGGGPIIMWG